MELTAAPTRPALARGTRTVALVVFTGLLLLGPLATPGLAADQGQLTMVVSQRWRLNGTQGTWTPYVVTVRNDGTASFRGEVQLTPNQTRAGVVTAFPTYRVPVSVPKGSEQSAVVYVIDAPSGYVAVLRDFQGRVVLREDLSSSTSRAGSAVAILSDLPQVEQRIAAQLRSQTRLDTALSRFTSAQSFPTNAVYLSGLNGVVIDQFNSAALSQAQVQALKDFVGLGGTLIAAGGPSWRFTLLPLPAELLPMRPAATATASLGPLAELGGLASDATTQVVTGDVLPGARATLSSPEGVPLVVEAVYGAGRVVELAFDPLAAPFDRQDQLTALAWTHAINRALSGVQGGSRSTLPAGISSGFGGSVSLAGPGAWAPGYGSGADQLWQILQDTPAAASPPVALLGGLLVAYVLLVGTVNYLFLKAVGHRGLMWATVPAAAVLFTAGAYGVGFGSRGSDFLVTEVQVQRLAPEGTVMAYSFDGIYAPRNGDVRLSLPANTLVSTAVAYGPLGESAGQAVVTVGSRSEVLLGNVAVWSMRPVQTLSVSHPFAYEPRQSMPIQADLRLQGGHVRGTVVNHSHRAISDLMLVTSFGSQARLAAALPPGGSASVDVELSPPPTQGSTREAGRAPRPAEEGTRQALLRLASTQAVSGRSGDLALVGLTGATSDTLLVEGAQPGRSVLAAIVQPVQLQAADSLSGIAPSPRLISNYLTDTSAQVDVYDLDLPSGLVRAPGLSYAMLGTDSHVSRVEVYDWERHAWRSLDRPPRSQATAPLTSGELSQGVVRVRVREASLQQAQLAVTDLP